jgi:hypothetical protein
MELCLEQTPDISDDAAGSLDVVSCFLKGYGQSGIFNLQITGFPMTALPMNELTIRLANDLRNLAEQSSAKFDVLKFFANADYARETIERLMTSELSALASLARNAHAALFTVAAEAETEAPAARPAAAPARIARAQTALTPVQRFSAIKDLMTALSVDASGMASFLFILKLEKCSSIGELKNLLPALQKLLIKKRGESAAPVLRQLELLLR